MGHLAALSRRRAAASLLGTSGFACVRCAWLDYAMVPVGAPMSRTQSIRLFSLILAMYLTTATVLGGWRAALVVAGRVRGTGPGSWRDTRGVAARWAFTTPAGRTVNLTESPGSIGHGGRTALRANRSTLQIAGARWIRMPFSNSGATYQRTYRGGLHVAGWGEATRYELLALASLMPSR